MSKPLVIKVKKNSDPGVPIGWCPLHVAEHGQTGREIIGVCDEERPHLRDNHSQCDEGAEDERVHHESAVGEERHQLVLIAHIACPPGFIVRPKTAPHPGCPTPPFRG